MNDTTRTAYDLLDSACSADSACTSAFAPARHAPECRPGLLRNYGPASTGIRTETFSRENYALFRAYLERHRKEIRAADLGLAAFVCVTSIEALTHTAVLHQEIVADEAIEALVDEATRFVVGYLTG